MPHLDEVGRKILLVTMNSLMVSLFQKVSGPTLCEIMELHGEFFNISIIIMIMFNLDFKFDGFSKETCRSMVAMIDVSNIALSTLSCPVVMLLDNVLHHTFP